MCSGMASQNSGCFPTDRVPLFPFNWESSTPNYLKTERKAEGLQHYCQKIVGNAGTGHHVFSEEQKNKKGNL